jgi:hypothetical protein
MKATVLLSKTFFQGHPKAGQETNFRRSVINGQGCDLCSGKNSAVICMDLNCNESSITRKIHTCRANYDYWKKKIDRLEAEGGVLSIRQWSGKPYRSPQEIIVDIPASEIGVQELTFRKDRAASVLVDGKNANFIQIARNDGLSANDFKSWFENCDLTQPLAIIHFTKFRY